MVVLQTELFDLPITIITRVLCETYIVIANGNEQIFYFYFAHCCVICVNINYTYDLGRKW